MWRVGPWDINKCFTLTLIDLNIYVYIKKIIKKVHSMNDVCDLFQDYLLAAGSGERVIDGGIERTGLSELAIVETT